MEIIEATISGLKVVIPRVFDDNRGSFFKTYQKTAFKEFGWDSIEWKEEYFSLSHKGVVRGMHFQTSPHDHEKIVTCLRGAVLDVVVDLRKYSPTFKRVESFELTGENHVQLLIPKGCAHGFLSLEDETLMFYKVSSEYSPNHDKGILWNSVDFVWPVEDAIVSERDQRHPRIEEYETPF